MSLSVKLFNRTCKKLVVCSVCKSMRNSHIFTGGVNGRTKLSALKPWGEFVICPDLPGMLLQMVRAKGVGDLWGEINHVSFDGRELFVTLSWTTNADPRRGRAKRTLAGTTIRLLPEEKGGAYYTSCAALGLRDLNSGSECFFRSPAIRTSKQGRGLAPKIVAI